MYLPTIDHHFWSSSLSSCHFIQSIFPVIIHLDRSSWWFVYISWKWTVNKSWSFWNEYFKPRKNIGKKQCSTFTLTGCEHTILVKIMIIIINGTSFFVIKTANIVYLLLWTLFGFNPNSSLDWTVIENQHYQQSTYYTIYWIQINGWSLTIDNYLWLFTDSTRVIAENGNEQFIVEKQVNLTSF